jgi:hypothetical protein
MKRRDFLKLSATGVASIIIGSHLPFLRAKDAFAATSNIEVTITDAVKEMVTHNAINDARCYFWVYRMKVDGVDIPVDCPGPTIYAIKGDILNFTIKNDLDEPHSLFIPGMCDSGPIAPGQTITVNNVVLNKSGGTMYYDNLNAPVNRVMGLHGALVVLPDSANGNNNYTPYDSPTAHVQNLFNSFGSNNVGAPVAFPGLRWQDGDPSNAGLTNPTPGFRQFVWLYHQASPRLFAEVGNHPAGQNYPAATFVQKFTRDPFSPTRQNGKPEFFTINGQSGFFSHFSPAITPMVRVGEPFVIHIMNAGLQVVSHHFHCNHFYVTSTGTAQPGSGPLGPDVSTNPIWVDVYGIKPMDLVDYTFPAMRPPDVPNIRGIGRPDLPLQTASGTPCWPPVEEMQTFIPPDFVPVAGTPAAVGAPTDANGNFLNMGQRLSPLCYPAHDHLEPSQTAQGGNYNCGLISGVYIIGDRNAFNQGLGDFRDFPMDNDFRSMFRNIRGLAVGGVNATREAAGPRPA